jgi:hypothetical protein
VKGRVAIEKTARAITCWPSNQSDYIHDGAPIDEQPLFRRLMTYYFGTRDIIHFCSADAAPQQQQPPLDESGRASVLIIWTAAKLDECFASRPPLIYRPIVFIVSTLERHAFGDSHSWRRRRGFVLGERDKALSGSSLAGVVCQKVCAAC